MCICSRIIKITYKINPKNSSILKNTHDHIILSSLFVECNAHSFLLIGTFVYKRFDTRKLNIIKTQ